MYEQGEGAGWLTFASIVLILAGVMRIFDAIWAWAHDGALPDGFDEVIFGDDLSTYGWMWFIVGVILIAAGLAVLQRAQWARWIGIVAASIMLITAFSWMPIYPVWSLLYVSIGILIIYGLGVYGERSFRKADPPRIV